MRTIIVLVFTFIYYTVSAQNGFIQKGLASYYGKKFHGKNTASGEKFNMYSLTAAHKTLPFNSYVKVTNLKNKKSVIVRITDRGPFVGNRIIDISKAAAEKIGMIQPGVAQVKIEVVKYKLSHKESITP